MENLYRKRIPKRSTHQRVVDLLRLSPDKFQQFQGLAKQYLGESVLHANIRKPKNKIKKSTWRTIRDVDSPSTLAALIHMEQSAHDDPDNEFHTGGGLLEGASSLFNGLWYSVGLGPEFQNWFGSFDYDAPENKPTKLDNHYAEIVQQSYKPITDRVDEIGDWDRDTSLDTDRYSTWVDDIDQAVHVAIRGTKANMSDIISDFHIIANNTSGNVDELTEYLEKVKDKYSEYELDASAHSLGSSELLEAGVNNPDLGFDRYNLFNPGQNPLWGLNNAQSAMDNDKFHWYLNSGDVLSNTFTSLLNDGTQVTWAKPGHSPLANHGLAQWTSEQY